MEYSWGWLFNQDWCDGETNSWFQPWIFKQPLSDLIQDISPTDICLKIKDLWNNTDVLLRTCILLSHLQLPKQSKIEVLVLYLRWRTQGYGMVIEWSVFNV